MYVENNLTDDSKIDIYKSIKAQIDKEFKSILKFCA